MSVPRIESRDHSVVGFSLYFFIVESAKPQSRDLNIVVQRERRYDFPHDGQQVWVLAKRKCGWKEEGKLG